VNILILDEESTGLAFAMRCADFDHSVRLWIPPEKTGDQSPIGKGIVERPAEWKYSIEWAHLIVMTGNASYRKEFQELLAEGLPVLGTCNEAREWEIDRVAGQQLFERFGIETASYETFEDFDKAIEFVRKERTGFAIKPWGGAADKSLSFIAKTPQDVIFKLERWRDEGKVKGKFMLQELIEGIEMGVSGWFGPGGWSRWIEEDWEEKRLMNDRLGPNTGEQGTTVRFTQRSKLFKEVLEPLTEALDECGFVGNINVNCGIDTKGQPWPFELTVRLGWPAFNIMLPLLQDDPAQWMLDLINGRDTLELSEDVAVGVVVTHGDYPHHKLTLAEVSGFPLRGLSNRNSESVQMQHVQIGKAPVDVGEKTEEKFGYVTAGSYAFVATGTGSTVKEASKRALRVAWDVEIGGADRQFRTDIGKRLKKELPLLQTKGYALGVEY